MYTDELTHTLTHAHRHAWPNTHACIHTHVHPHLNSLPHSHAEEGGEEGLVGELTHGGHHVFSLLQAQPYPALLSLPGICSMSLGTVSGMCVCERDSFGAGRNF